MQLWGSLRDFVDQSHAWTEDAILDDDGGLLLNMEAIKVAVEEYGTRAYKAGKANKEVSCCTLHWRSSVPGMAAIMAVWLGRNFVSSADLGRVLLAWL